MDVATDVLAHVVPALLAPDGKYVRIRELVTTIGYLEQKLLRVGIVAVLDVLRVARRLAPDAETAAELGPLEVALAEAAQIVLHDPAQLRGQLLARIPRPATADLSTLLDESAAWRERTWLRPFSTAHNHGHLASFEPMVGMIDAVAVSDDATILLAGDRDGGLAAWDLTRRERIGSVETAAAVNAIAFRPGSYEAFVALNDGGVARWSPAEQRLRLYEELDEYAATALAVGAGMLVYSGGPEVRGGSVDADGSVWRSSAGQDLVTAVAIVGDGERCVSGARDGSLALWRLTDGRALGALPQPVDRVLCLAALPRSATVVVGGKDKRVVGVDVDSGATRVVGRHAKQVRAAAAFGDHHVVTGSFDGSVRIWDVAPGAASAAATGGAWRWRHRAAAAGGDRLRRRQAAALGPGRLGSRRRPQAPYARAGRGRRRRPRRR